jgi:hypothetical protein
LYTIVPCLLDQADLTLPIYIRLSDFQNIKDPNDIYKQIIIKIVQEMTSVYLTLKDSQKLAALHIGIQTLSINIFGQDNRIKKMFEKLRKLSADEYVERSVKALTGGIGASSKFFDLSAQYSKQAEIELKKKPNPGIEEITAAYDTLLKPFNGKLLILIDEAGSVNKSFFKEHDDISMFETLMNQLRTLNYVRTKVAIYPQAAADNLPETRYGDAILLQADLKNEKGFLIFENRCISVIEKYIEKFAQFQCNIEDVFDVESNRMDVLEQIINASDGNMRRFVQLLDLTLNFAYKENVGKERVNISQTYIALREHARSLEHLFSETEIDFLDTISSTCKARNTYKFRFPNKSIDILRYTNKSSEYNIINLIELGSGRKGSVYGFDYAYSIYKEIPTHNIKNSERIDKNRSKVTGQWISKITTINDNIIEHSKILGKIEGTIDYVTDDRSGFITGDDGKKYFFMEKMIIENDKGKKIRIGTRTRFLPNESTEGSLYALYTEIL